MTSFWYLCKNVMNLILSMAHVGPVFAHVVSLKTNF